MVYPESNDSALVSGPAILHLFHDLVNREARRLLARRELFEGCQEIANIRLSRHQQEGTFKPPVPIGVRSDARPLIGVRAQVE
jgi:hypothetical protein